MMNKNFIFLFLFVALLAACFLPKRKEAPAATYNDKIALLQVDKDFATLSMQKGLKNAYMEYIDSNGILLRPNSMPILDAEAIDYILEMKDTGYRISWMPTSAVLAQSGELGYTYGTYQVVLQAKADTLYGTYVTIWKKQEDGKWKFALQSNNEGVE